jgi:hypothetical protein
LLNLLANRHMRRAAIEVVYNGVQFRSQFQEYSSESIEQIRKTIDDACRGLCDLVIESEAAERWFPREIMKQSICAIIYA